MNKLKENYRKNQAREYEIKSLVREGEIIFLIAIAKNLQDRDPILESAQKIPDV